MSKTTSAKVSKLDWDELMALAHDADRPLSDDDLAMWKAGMIDGNARMWNTQYVHAVQKALEGTKPAELIAMLNAKIPVPTFLLPALAAVMQGVSGRPAEFSALEDGVVRDAFDFKTQYVKMSDAEARKDLAKMRCVTVKTINRSLKRTDKRRD